MSDIPKFEIRDLRPGDTIDLVLTLSKNTSPYPTASITDVWFTAKFGAGDSDAQAVIRKILGAGITITDPVVGTLTITLDPADTRSLVMPVSLVADVQIKETSGKVTTVCQGVLRFVQDITRAT